MTRDEFPTSTKRTLAERAAHMCSNPNCRTLTVELSTDDPEHVSSSGVAAHITAAEAKGPRYDPDLSSEARRSIKNGIWLCHACSRRVDDNPSDYPPDTLREWKQLHEKFVAHEEIVPPPPSIQLDTRAGLRHLQRVSEEDHKTYREHCLTCFNQGDRALHNVRLHLRIPERITDWHILSSPPGETVEAQVATSPLTVRSEGPGSVVAPSQIRHPLDFRVECSRLLPDSRISIDLTTEIFDSVADSHNGLHTVDDVDVLIFYVSGQYLYTYRNSYIPRIFLHPISFNSFDRTLTVGEQLSAEELSHIRILRTI